MRNSVPAFVTAYTIEIVFFGRTRLKIKTRAKGEDRCKKLEIRASKGLYRN